MSGNENVTPDPSPDVSANPGYALGQLAKALTTQRAHPDAGARARAAQKIEDWVRVFSGMLRGELAVGSRTPVAGTPAWATLRVVGGGFPTGELLAEGPLLEHERALLARLGTSEEDAPRARLNAYYLTEQGMGDLLESLRSGCYRVGLPEEGALLAVAWLLANGGAEGAEEARAILDEIAPFFARLRFYPLPHPRPLEASALVRVQDVGASVAQLRAARDRPVALRQREAAQVWAPLYDRLVRLFLETVDESGPPRVCLDPAGRPRRRPSGS